MSDSALIDAFLRGMGAGAVIVVALALWRSSVSRHVRIAILLLGVTVPAWLICEAPAMWQAFGSLYVILAASYPVGGFFWLFVVTVFEDRPITLARLAPAAVLLLIGISIGLAPQPASDALSVAFNIGAGLLAAHASLVIARGWRDDLMDARRRARGVLLGLVSLYVLVLVTVALAHKVDPAGPWLVASVGHPLGGAVITLLILGQAAIFLQARPSVFGAIRRADNGPDARAEATDRLAIERLQATMAAEGWRREGLTIGDLARELDVPEHRLRRLINQRLGHRNFADFVNGHRIEAAKRRLADPAEARVTVAAIAFDLGYGSLGPFNRAFRAATGVTPTEYRREALDRASPKLSEAV